MSDLSEAIKTEARRLGFSLVGITTSEPPPHFDFYESWLLKGRHGEMAYLASEPARERRSDPRIILPECKSIVVVGAPYNAALAGEAAPGNSGRGRVAAYAWGEDYHEVLKPRLRKLVEFVEESAGRPIPNRWYTDTGPILERDLAQRAGLGWIGKNTCLINPSSGSYYFLAEILLGIPLKPDASFSADHCGSCTRCIEACPTACILPDRTLDASRCLSYLTIERKGAIPVELRAATGRWVFGCDICQIVCPWNVRFAPRQGDPAFSGRVGVPQPDLLGEIKLSPPAFNRKFKNSPVRRAKRRGYLRNVAVALGNGKDPAAVPALSEVLTAESEPLVRAHAAWALGEIGGQEAAAALTVASAGETEAEVLQEIQRALQAVSP